MSGKLIAGSRIVAVELNKEADGISESFGMKHNDFMLEVFDILMKNKMTSFTEAIIDQFETISSGTLMILAVHGLRDYAKDNSDMLMIMQGMDRGDIKLMMDLAQKAHDGELTHHDVMKHVERLARDGK